MSTDDCYCWCLDCGYRVPRSESAGLSSCPKCGSRGVPCGPDQDMTVEVNWHELRVLGIWAEHHARSMKDGDRFVRTVQAICRRLQRQHPGLTPLTLSEEVAELPRKLAEAGIAHGCVESTVPRPAPLPVNGPGAVGHARRLQPGEPP